MEDTREIQSKGVDDIPSLQLIAVDRTQKTLSVNQASTLRPTRCQLSTQRIKDVANQAEKKNYPEG
jgi:hypothetical protein